jgi:hypothetical protein
LLLSNFFSPASVEAGLGVCAILASLEAARRLTAAT